MGLGFTPWDGVTGPTHRQHLTSATFAADMAAFSYLNLNYLFYSCTNRAKARAASPADFERWIPYATACGHSSSTHDIWGLMSDQHVGTSNPIPSVIQRPMTAAS